MNEKIAQRIASWTWNVTHERALSPADLFGGKAPVGALILIGLLAFWSEFASACAAQVNSLCASVTAVYLPFLVFGESIN